MNGKYKISIIVPAYNVEKYIEKCSISILKQTYENIELIIVNDGSTDNTAQIIDDIAKLDNRVRIIHKENAGVSSTRNVGIENATGDYIVFVDGDDFISADYIEYMLSLVETTGADFCLSKHCYEAKDEPQTKVESVQKFTPGEATALLLSPIVKVGCWNKIFKRTFLNDNNIRFSIELFYGEGLEFITTAAQRSTCVGVGNKKVYYYRRNNEFSACTKFNINNLKNGWISLNYIEEHLTVNEPPVVNMLIHHKCNYCVGAIVRMRSNRCVKEYKDDYLIWKQYLHKNTRKLMFKRDISFYRKMLFLSGCLFPQLLVYMDNYRRKRIAKKSVN